MIKEKKSYSIIITLNKWQIVAFIAVAIAIIIGVYYVGRTLIHEENCDCTPPVKTHVLDQLELSLESDGRYHMHAESPRAPGGSVRNQPIPPLDASLEAKFNFGDIVAGKQYIYDHQIDFINVRYAHEMIAICANGNDMTDPTKPTAIKEIKGFVSVRDTKYPPPNRLTSPTNNPEHDIFTGWFDIKNLALRKQPDTGFYSINFILKQHAPSGETYKFHSYDVYFDNIHHMNALVVLLEKDTGMAQNDIIIPPKSFVLSNFSTRYLGRPGGWPGGIPEQRPTGCSVVEKTWDNSEPIAVVVFDKDNLSTTGMIDWNLISKKKAQLCFK